MSQERTLLTQGQIEAVNEVISTIARNLGVHVNESLSKAHGINAKFATYTDSAGDTVGNIVLIFDFGTAPNIKRLYVPAIVSTIGPSGTSNGVTHSDIGPTGSANSPGIPLTPAALLSVFPPYVSDNLAVYNSLLLAHTAGISTDQGVGQVHGGASYSTSNSLDSLGHVAGQFLVQISINGTAFNLVANDSVVVPQPPRVQPLTPSSLTMNHS